MIRFLPGSVEVEGREFVYVECRPRQKFSELMNDILTAATKEALPRSGGAIEEKTRVILADGTALLAMSYKGDMNGWKSAILNYCSANGRLWGILKEDALVLSNGRQDPLVSCTVLFE